MNISSTSSSSSNSSTSYSRITGLATGMDTDGMVKQALTPYQTKIDSAKQDLQYTQWQQEAYVGFITDLKTFNDNFDILKPDNMMLSGSYAGSTAASTLSSGVDASNYLTATTLPGAVKGNYQVQINSLAQSAQSQNYFGTAATFTDASKWSGKTIGFTVGNSNPTTYYITLDNLDSASTAQDVVDNINKKIGLNTNLNGKLNVGFADNSISFMSNLSDTKITLVNGDSTVSNSSISDLSAIDGKDIKNYTRDTKLSSLGVTNLDFKITIGSDTFNMKMSDLVSQTSADPTIDDFVTGLQSLKSGDVPITKYFDISFSDLTKKLTIATKDTGSSENFSVADNLGNLKSLFGFGGSGSYTGNDANISIKAPGESSFVQVSKSSNSFTIDNIKYNLVSAKPGDTINLNVKSDASAQVDRFKKFVDKYNELIDKINTKLNEKKNYDYKPLTDAQKSSMKDTEITAWETKAKEGILRRDTYLNSVVTKMRQALYNTVSGAGISLTDIGITTTSNYMDGGKLTVDETKLKSALENKGDLVQKLFTQNVGTTDETKGIFQRFKNIINDAAGTDGSLIKKAGYTNTRWVSTNDLSKNIADKNSKIKSLQTLMTQKQQSLYSMYATLEQNMNKLNSQSSWLASSLGAQ